MADKEVDDMTLLSTMQGDENFYVVAQSGPSRVDRRVQPTQVMQMNLRLMGLGERLTCAEDIPNQRLIHASNASMYLADAALARHATGFVATGEVSGELAWMQSVGLSAVTIEGSETDFPIGTKLWLGTEGRVVAAPPIVGIPQVVGTVVKTFAGTGVLRIVFAPEPPPGETMLAGETLQDRTLVTVFDGAVWVAPKSGYGANAFVIKGAAESDPVTVYFVGTPVVRSSNEDIVSGQSVYLKNGGTIGPEPLAGMGNIPQFVGPAIEILGADPDELGQFLYRIRFQAGETFPEEI